MQRKSITKRRGCNGHVPLCYSYIHGKCSKGYITVIQREPDCNMSSRKPCCITCNLLRAFMLAIKLYERSTTSSWPHDTKYTYIVPCNRFMFTFCKSAFYIIFRTSINDTKEYKDLIKYLNMVGPILDQAWLFLYMWVYMGLFHPRFQNDILFETSSCASCCTCRSRFWILCYTWYLCPWGMEKRKRNLRRFYKWHLGRAGQIFCFYFKSHFTFKVIIHSTHTN